MTPPGVLYLVAFSGVEEYHRRLSCAMDTWSVLHMLSCPLVACQLTTAPLCLYQE